MSVMITMMIMMQWGIDMIISTKLNLVPTVILIGRRARSGPCDDLNENCDIIIIILVIKVIMKDLGRGRVDDIEGLAESSTAESGEYEYRL